MCSCLGCSCKCTNIICCNEGANLEVASDLRLRKWWIRLLTRGQDSMTCRGDSGWWQKGQGRWSAMCLVAKLSPVGKEFLNNGQPAKEDESRFAPPEYSMSGPDSTRVGGLDLLAFEVICQGLDPQGSCFWLVTDEQVFSSFWIGWRELQHSQSGGGTRILFCFVPARARFVLV